MNTIRLAVIGAGGQCTGALMPALPNYTEFDLVAICDLQENLAARNARNFGARTHYTDATKMLREEAPDAVIVVGPPQMHEEVGLQALEAGCHLFVEKPSSPTVEGAERLWKAAQSAGKIGQVGHMMRHAGPVQVASELAQSPEFGKLLSVESKYTTWPTSASFAGAGWGDSSEDWTYMLVQGGHPIDLMRHFLGDIRRVSAFCAHGTGVTKVYQVITENEAGQVGFLNLQDSYNGWTTGLELVGDGQATVRVDDLGRVSYRSGEKKTEAEGRNWGNTSYIWEPHHTLPNWKRAGYGTQFGAWAKCIQEGKQAAPSLRDAWLNLVTARGILESIESGQTVTLPVIP